MQFDLVHIWASMGLVAKSIAMVLLLMAIACAGVAVERLIALAKSARESRAFASKAAPLIDKWQLSELVELCSEYKASALAKLFGPILKRYLGAKDGNYQSCRNGAQRVGAYAGGGGG